MPKIDMLQLRKEIKSDEGVVLHGYQDHLGYLTIGVGRLIDKRKGGGISEFEADFLLDNDLNKIIGLLDFKLPWIMALSDARQRALINMAFQLGVNGLLNFKTMLTALKEGRYEDAAKAAMASKWAQQTPERAKRIANIFKNG